MVAHSPVLSPHCCAPPVEAAVLAVNQLCGEEDVDSDQFLASLQNEHLALSDVLSANLTYYTNELKKQLLAKRSQVSCTLLCK